MAEERLMLTKVLGVIVPVNPPENSVVRDPNASAEWKGEPSVSISLIGLCKLSVRMPQWIINGALAAVWKYFQHRATCPERTLDQIVVMAVVEFDSCNDATTEFRNVCAVLEAVCTVNIGGPFSLVAGRLGDPGRIVHDHNEGLLV